VLEVCQALLRLPDPLLGFGNAAVLQLRRLREVAGPLRAFDLVPQALEFLLVRTGVLDGGLLLLPVAPEAVARLLEVG